MNANPNPAKAIFLEAVEKHDPDQWSSYLDRACAGQPELRRQVEQLLQAHHEVSTNLNAAIDQDAAPSLVATIDDPVSERPGTVIGPYRLMEQIGEGGMGLVYVAEQQQPVRRKVALKVIKPGMDTRQVVARFEAERQALALMDHPNIAKVHDGGTTDSGRPYFVMELVKGVLITEYCDQNQAPIRQRLELFVSVCRAVQHAHLKGIIHRDIKPSNVLVMSHDGTPVVKVIDFGVAKAIAQQLTDKTIYTQFSQMVGTPLYMSPEQAGMSGLDVDTRSDIYSLGVLLYELLTGTTPFDKELLHKVGFDEIRRIIREEEPPKPSTCISTLGQAAATVSKQRRSEPRQLRRLFRGELDWIVMKALEKDRNRRYETATGMARDVQRYLNDEPVLACPPSVWYRLRKFTRRNKAGLGIAALILLLIAVVGGGGGWLVRDRAVRQREVQSKQKETEDKVVEARTMAEMLLSERQPGDPVLVAAVQRVEALLDSGNVSEEVRQRAEQLLRDVRMLADLDEIRLRQAESKDGAMFDTAGTEKRYAEAFSAYGLDVAALESEEAAARIRASAIREALLAGLDAWMQLKPAQNQERSRLRAVADGADESAWRRAFREAALTADKKKLQELAGQKEALAQPPSVLAWLASVLKDAGLRKESKAILRQAQQRYPQDFWINYNLGHFLILGPPPHHPDEAVGYFRVAVAMRPGSAEARSILGLALQGKGDFEGAIATLQQAVALDPKFPVARGNLGAVLTAKGRLDEAIAQFREVLRINPNAPEAHHNLGRALLEKGRLDEVIFECGEAIRLKPDGWDAWYVRGWAYLKQGRRNKGLDDFAHVIDKNPTDARAWIEQGRVYSDLLKEHEKAISDYSKAVELNPQDPDVWICHGSACISIGRYQEAVTDFSKAIGLKPDSWLAWRERGVAYWLLAQWDQTLADETKAIELKPNDDLAWHNRAIAYVGLHQYDKAASDLCKALELNPDCWSAWNIRGYLHRSLGQKDKALEDFSKAIEIAAAESKLWSNRGLVRAALGQSEGAVADFSKAIELARSQKTLWFGKDPLPLLYRHRGAVFMQLHQYDKALADYTTAIEREPKNAGAWNRLAWFLATCPDAKFWEANKAVALAKKAVELASNQGSYWNTLGVAHYRARDWKSAAGALAKSMELRKGGDAFDWFFLAMIRWHQGDKKEARKWFDQAVQWMDKNERNNEELLRFREETEKVLQLKK